MLWKKESSMRYVDMCIYIDAHIPDIAENGKYPEVENTVYNYLWLLVKALAIKKRMFQNFEDYDGYAFYSANRLFFALRKNYQNQGKIIKGKLIRPIKSCLNYTKALLYPMKVEYQREAYMEVLSDQVLTQKFDTFEYKARLKAQAGQSQNWDTITLLYLTETLQNCDKIINNVLEKSPFHPAALDYKKLKMSLLLNCLYSINTKKTLDWDPASIILWKLPKSMSSYVKILIREFYTALKTEIMDCCSVNVIDDAILEKIIAMPDGEYKDYEDQ